MKIHLRLVYWNPFRQQYRPLPADLSVQVYDEDIGFHDTLGAAVTTGRDLEIDVKGWGDYDPPDLYFEIATQDRLIDLEREVLLPSGATPKGPVLRLPPGRWDSRTFGPGRVLDDVNPEQGLGTAASPFQLALEAARAWYRPVYWNRLAPLGGVGASGLQGAHRPVPEGVTFHLEDRQGTTVGQGRVDANGLLYVPIWKAVDAVALKLDADYREPLVIALVEGRVVRSDLRRARGEFLTITGWEQGRPVLAPHGSEPRFTPVAQGRTGQAQAGLDRAEQARVSRPEAPIPVDISSSPWTFGNRITHLVDGDETFRAMVDAIRRARHTIHLSGWDFQPSVWMERLSGSRQTMAELLMQQADAHPELQVRILVWANPIEFFTLRAVVKRFHDHAAKHHGNLRVELSTCPHTRSHHQKMLTIDGHTGFVGGIDVSWGRWDTPEHRPGWSRQGFEPDFLEGGDFKMPVWHDVHSRVAGPVVAALERNFRSRWRAAAGEELPIPPMPEPFSDGVPVMAARTWPKEVDGCDCPEADELCIRTLYLRAVSAAQRNIYIEQQYLNSKPLTKAIVSRIEWARANGIPDFRVTVILPSKYDEPGPVGRHIAWLQEQCLTLLRTADPEQRYLRLLCLRTWDAARASYQPIYIHAKLMIVDDHWVTIGSANSNNRSLEYDTELNLVMDEPASTTALRRRLLEEHARGPLPEAHAAAVDRLFSLALENQQALETGQPGPAPERRRAFLHRSDNVPERMPLPEGTETLF